MDCIGIPYWIQVVYKYQYGFVILVGAVDTVDKKTQPPYLDEDHAPHPTPLVDRPNQKESHLWVCLDNLSTPQETQQTLFRHFPYFGFDIMCPPYLGV